MTTEILMAGLIGCWIGIALVKISDAIVSYISKRQLLKTMDSILGDLKKANEIIEEMKKEEQKDKKEEKVKKPRAKKTQK